MFTNAALTVAVGDSVRVVGRVTEFRPGGTGGTNNLTITELITPTFTILSSGNTVPAPTIVGLGGRMPPTNVIDDDTSGDIEVGPTVFDPANDGIDFYESLEGMIVQVNNAHVVGPTKDFGEFVFLPDNGSWATGPRTPRGGILYRYEDGNPERLTVDDEILRDLIVPRPSKAMVDVNVGDRITSPIVGPLDYSFANFKIQATSMPTAAPSDLRPETTFPRFFALAVATFNVENLDPGDGATIGRLAGQIVNNLLSPDLIGIEEVQDNNGEVNNGVVDASQSWNLLITAIRAAGGPTYQYRQIDPVDNQDGGAPGGNIRVGFLFRTDRGLSFVDRPGGTSTSADRRGRRPVGAAADVQPGPDRPLERGLDRDAQVPRGRVHVGGQEAVRGRQPLQLEGRGSAALRPVPAARAAERGSPAPAGAGRERLRRPAVRGRSEGERDRARRHQRLRVLDDGRHPRRRRHDDADEEAARVASATRTSSRATRRCSTRSWSRTTCSIRTTRSTTSCT